VKFTERKELLYDPEIFRKAETQTALRINREWTVKHSPQPPPRFMEVNRQSAKFDALWHVPLDDRTVFLRVMNIPCINSFEKPDWRLTKVGIVPKRKDKFTMSHLLLQEFDYFPVRGDMVFFNGYRYMIVNVVLEPQAYWHQTNVWTGLVVECQIPPEGDARPVPNLAEPTLAELFQTRALPEV
jgi:hypothetical protein